MASATSLPVMLAFVVSTLIGKPCKADIEELLDRFPDVKSITQTTGVRAVRVTVCGPADTLKLFEWELHRLITGGTVSCEILPESEMAGFDGLVTTTPTEFSSGRGSSGTPSAAAPAPRNSVSDVRSDAGMGSSSSGNSVNKVGKWEATCTSLSDLRDRRSPRLPCLDMGTAASEPPPVSKHKVCRQLGTPLPAVQHTSLA